MASPLSRHLPPTPHVREFGFNDEDFEALRGLIKSITGIHLSDQKRELVYGRLSRRLRALNLPNFQAYRKILASNPEEIAEFTNAITTNLTAFFRERHHFDYLRDQVLAPMVADRRATRRVRIWSAGCSSGEEPYSIAMTVLEAVDDPARWDIRVLATDLDSEVLSRARAGQYGPERLASLNSARLERFFALQHTATTNLYQVRPEVASLITFKQLNLMHPLPMKGPLDVIFCRNTVIYFDRETQRDLFSRVARLQRPGASLILGHSESLFQISNDYTLVGKSIYRRN